MLKPLCLVVDDEPDLLELSVRTLSPDIDCRTANNLTEAKQLLQENIFDLCFTDMRLSNENGIDLVAYIVQNYPDTPVAMITAYGNVEVAVQALKMGAFDFITKPVDVHQLRNLAETALRLSKRYQQPEEYPEKQRTNVLAGLVGRSDAMQELRKQVEKYARSQAPVCIKGESGSGKEIVARLIHTLGPRADKPFVPVNCGAIPVELMEREFFGHQKGSFTGAINNKPGLFQAAHNGTLFLDEIAELPLLMQVKLLRAIQEKQIRPLGSTREISVDVRILSATNRDLKKLVKVGRFRQDLFFRINVIELQVPSLREHKEDIPDLVEHILIRLSSELAIPKPEVSSEFMLALQAHSFPGNVRELENIIERAIAQCDNNLIKLADLQLLNYKEIPEIEDKSLAVTHSDSDSDSDYSDSLPQPLILKEVEIQTILKALEQTRGNKTQAAKLLGISFNALRYRLRKLKKKTRNDKSIL